jgi:hypothetical protein
MSQLALSPLRRLQEQRQLEGKRKVGVMLQPAISNFFGGIVPEKKKLRIVEKIFDGIRGIRCEYCGVTFTPQGILNHTAAHVRKGDSRNVERANPSGRVVRIVGGTSQVTSVDSDPSSQCRFCGYWFSPDNYEDHVVWHQGHKDAALIPRQRQRMASINKNPKIIVQGPLRSDRANCHAIETL